MTQKKSFKDLKDGIIKTAKDTARDSFDIAGDLSKKGKDILAEKSGEILESSLDFAKGSSKKVMEKSQEAYRAAVSKIDENGNGEIDIEDIIILSMKLPGMKIDRAEFLRKELSNKVSEEQLSVAIASNPMKAGIDMKIIDKVVDSVIQFERNSVSGISGALSMAGGVAMVATIPADITQYYGYMLRAAQKMMYLYGFPSIDGSDGEALDSTTINMLTLCLGVMYGVAGANTAIKSMALALGNGVSKQLMRKALTKGTIYPIVKATAKWFNVKMTKEIFAGFFKKSIPVLGGVIGAGMTYASFKPCCDKLQASLKDTSLSNPNFTPSEEDLILEAEIVENNDE